jgi:DNA-binding NarL/FixJ family response regulator
VLLADDQELFADNLRLVLETLADDIAVVGIASKGKDAVARALEEKPDIVLMDVSMPVMDGVEAAKIINEKLPGCKVVMLTTFPDDAYVKEAVNNGAYGYILKNMRSEDLIASLRAVARGAAIFSPDILAQLVKPAASAASSSSEPNRSAEYDELLRRLGKREKEILDLVAKGYTNQKIADELFISEPTVRNYISGIYAKVGTKDRLHVIDIVRAANGAGA